jgi:hypothetical protein
MSRNSEIVRAGVGGRVAELADDGETAPAIAAIVSRESGHDISKHMVHRHLQKGGINAAVIPHEVGALKLLAAAISGLPDTRDSAITGTTYFGRYKLDTSNVFAGYYAIAREISGQVSRGFKNIALKITNGARIVGDERDADKIQDLMKAIDFSSVLQNIVRYTCEMGTCVTGLKTTDGKYTVPQILPMSSITLLTDRETVGTINNRLIIHGPVTKIVLDEGKANQIIYNRDDVGLFRIWAGGHEFKDIKGRDTFGIYGESMVVGVEGPLKSLLNASYYYDEFIKRYGLGRLHINMKLLADMLLDKKITTVAAAETREGTTAALQKIGANEDLITMGEEVSMIESKTGFNIVPYLELRERQINHALLQSDIGAGEVGSAWTSAGTAVSAQELVTLQSLRDTLFQMFMEEIVIPRLDEFSLDPRTISIVAEPLSQAPVPYRDLIEMRDRGDITQGEMRTRAGFSYEKPDEE